MPLPNDLARMKMIEKFIPEREEDVKVDQIAEKTIGYSGSDIRSFCKEALMRPLRRFVNKMELPNGKYRRLKGEARMDKVSENDVLEALECSNPSPAPDDKLYRTWFEKYGST